MSQTDITRMSSDYADNELELFKKTVSYCHRISSWTRFMFTLYIFHLNGNGWQFIWSVLIQIELIVGSENGKISSTDILNSADLLTTKKIKKSESEQVLKRLVQDKWLNEVKKKKKNLCVIYSKFL